MQRITTLFRRYALWLQTALILILALLLIFAVPANSRTNPESYLQMLGSLALPYLISGDRTGLQQAIDLIIQNSPVLDARILNTENRPLAQVINRSISEQQRNSSDQHSTELVLDQTLLGTLTISMSPETSSLPVGLLSLALLTLMLGIGQMCFGTQPSGEPRHEKQYSTHTKSRFLVAISLGPLIEQIKQEGSQPSFRRLDLLLKVVRGLAPSYGLEFVTISDETLFLQSHADETHGLRQAIVFTWNACQSLGADRGKKLRGTISTLDLSGEPLISNLALIAEDQIDICTALLARGAGGSVSFSQDLASSLPRDWTLQQDDDRQLCLVNELPAAVCALWRRQLSSLKEE